MRKNCLVGLLLALFLALHPLPVFADFYQKDFAKAPGGTLHDENPLPAVTKAPRAPSPWGSGANASPQKIQNASGKPVLEIGLLVNSNDAITTIAKLTEFLTAHPSVKLGPLSIAGPAATGALASTVLKLKRQGVRILESNNRIFGGSTISPTWVIGTASGYHLLEGLSGPEFYINKRLEFVSPDSLVEAPTPIPSMENEKF